MIAALAATHAQAFVAIRPWSEAEFASLLASPGVILAGDPTAFALGRVTADEAEILTLATAPADQRMGKGRVVLAQFEALAKATGATAVYLEVAIDNTAALSLYATAGYAEVGRRPHYYATPTGTPIAALVLRKAL